MNTWTFDLTTEHDPLLRLGLHGLWRTLHYGEGSDQHSQIYQTDSLSWELTSTTITLNWETVEDLNRLMQGVLGDLRHGIAVPPGWEDDPGKVGFYATARAHLGILGIFFRSRKNGRSQSLVGGSKPADKAKKAAAFSAWEEHTGHEILKSVGCRTLPSGELEKIVVSPHGYKPVRGPTLKVTGKKMTLSKSRPLSGMIHPNYAQWRKIAVKSSSVNYFLLSFSCVSYLYTCSGGGVVGLGVDGGTFQDVDKYHKRWGRRAFLYCSTEADTALWLMASQIRLPTDRSYPTLSQSQTGAICGFLSQGLSIKGSGIQEFFSASLRPRDHEKTLYALTGLPVRCDHEGKTLTSYHSVLLQSLRSKGSWTRGLDNVFYNLGGNPFESQQKLLHKLMLIFGDEMEQQVMTQMNRVFSSLVIYYYGKEGNWTKARSRAHEKVSITLRRANTQPALFEALTGILNLLRSEKKAVNTFPENQMRWMWEESAKNPAKIRALLLAACSMRVPKSPKPSDADSPTPVETPTV